MRDSLCLLPWVGNHDPVQPIVKQGGSVDHLQARSHPETPGFRTAVRPSDEEKQIGSQRIALRIRNGVLQVIEMHLQASGQGTQQALTDPFELFLGPGWFRDINGPAVHVKPS
jgi:hypothetical protein